ncbi:hypothetical protein SARC_05455 [Sphaeroforma arctica JP610]|uniref:Uncharacterized protein n=1 Tax=Sphaeroforma arctica JP610 TaxID=667725 RepID=A0A0L0G228_9EUKA|nr:hypothetical protein SARC_05455 [Sphaeroforma arctica JP610]KNC82248.1 hypothetical protein SARC_05455 [Sphaeroforma arctica JP610]|eukprot:XP_014156150.1 hypothetical protein SARC_05455 [Sphaeroforma arctica JP610]
MFSLFRTKTSYDMASEAAVNASGSSKHSKLPVRPWPFLASASKNALPRKSCPAVLLANPNFADQSGRRVFSSGANANGAQIAAMSQAKASNNLPGDYALYRNNSESDSEQSNCSVETSPAHSPTVSMMFMQGTDPTNEIRRQESNTLAEYGLDITVGSGKY